jgi:hypothetical protein
VQKAGYAPKTVEGIVVKLDEDCGHVITQQVVVRLSPVT